MKILQEVSRSFHDGRADLKGLKGVFQGTGGGDVGMERQQLNITWRGKSAKASIRHLD